MKRTSLYEAHRELGAKFVEFAGYSMPVHYQKGVMKEHLHTRAASGLFDVSHMGQIKVTSKENNFDKVIEGLESLMPADLKALEINRQCYSFFTNERGGVIDDLMIVKHQNHFLLVVNASRKYTDYNYLKQRIGHFCHIEWVNDRSLLALQGPMSEKILSKFSSRFNRMNFLDVLSINILGVQCWVSRSGYTGEDGFELSIPNGDVQKVFLELLRDRNVMAAGLGARDSLRLEAGLCLYGQDLTETKTPIEASLSWAIHRSRRNGGFPGEKIILDQLSGFVPQKRVGLAPIGRAPIREGCEIFSDLSGSNQIGQVTSGGFSPTLNKPISIAFVKAEWARIGTEVSVSLRGKRTPALIRALPFVESNYRYKERK